MVISFTLKDFLEMIATYNKTFWPMQIIVYALGLIALLLAIINTDYSSKFISAILVFFWMWVGMVFEILFFSKLFPLSISTAILIIIEGLLLAWFGIFKKDLTFKFKLDVYGVVGSLIIFYGMIVYPAIEYLLRRGYPQLLLVGLTPCPTVIFTLGMLLWSEKLPKYIVVIPFIYSLSGVIPISIGIAEDIGLVVTGFIVFILIQYRDYIKRKASR